MEKNEQIRQASGDEMLNEISTLLMESWPMMRKRLLHINELQTECSMPVSHIQLLAMLAHEEALSITQISERFGIAKPNITPMVDRMIAEGLVMRTRSSQDKRIVSVVICDKGRERLEQIHASLCRVLLGWTGSLDEKQITDLRDALRTIVRIVCQI